MKAESAARASPKSKIFRLQSSFTTMLLGLRSWQGRRERVGREERVIQVGEVVT